MADNRKYFLDLGGLQSLWNKMKSTFAVKSDVNAINTQIGTINNNLNALQSEVDGVEALTLSYAPKTATNYSNALTMAGSVPAGTVIVVGSDEEVDGITYSEGFYIVDNSKSIHYIGTSTGANSEDEIAALRERISNVEKEIIKNVAIIDENGNSLGVLTIANNSLLVRHDDAVIANTESVNALTHRAIAKKFGELESLLTRIPKFKIEVVDEIPSDNVSFSTIYLVKNVNSSNQNFYTEYIYIQDSANGNHWEKLGEQTIALDNYVTKEFLTNTLNDAIKNFVTKSEVDTLVEKSKTDILAEVEKEYVKIGDANFVTEESIITSIKEGKIGEQIVITPDQIESLV